MLKQLLSFILLFLAFSSCSWNSKDSSAPVISKIVDTPLNNLFSKDEMEAYHRRIDASVDSIFSKSPLNGSLLVAKDGVIIYEKYEGYINYRHKTDLINSNSSFHLASVSKTITATAILQLWQDKKLEINDPVSKYLAGFPIPDITVKSLLNHRSGLPNYVHYMEQLGWKRSNMVRNEDVLNFIIQNYKKIGINRVDRSFNYSNTNYALLALIVERVTGSSFEGYLSQHFFQPLGMTNSYVFDLTDSLRSMPSFFRSGRQYAFDYLDLVYGDKNIYSTVQDIQKFEYALSSGSILNEETLNAAYAPYSKEKPGTHNYGLGWRMLELKNGKKIIYHNGWWHGNRTSFYRLPDEHVTIIALCNNDASNIYSIKRIANIFGPYFPSSEFSAPSSPIRHSKKTIRTRKKSKVSIKKRS